MFIYLDESGDLGFDLDKEGTSRYFTITLLVCYTDLGRKDIRNSVKRTLRNKLNHKRNKTRIIEELKGTNTTINVKKYFFRQIKRNDWSIYSLILNKCRVSNHLRNKTGKKKLYNFLSRFLLDQIDMVNIGQYVNLIVDKSKNKEEIKDFNSYLVNQLEAKLPLNLPLYISHLNSKESYELQAVDLFCWGIARKYSKRDTVWYEVFKDKINYEDVYLR